MDFPRKQKLKFAPYTPASGGRMNLAANLYRTTRADRVLRRAVIVIALGLIVLAVALLGALTLALLLHP